MLNRLAKEAHYQYRCLRLAGGLLGKKLIHCNLQVTYRCNFQCQICDFWKKEYDKSQELSPADIRLIGKKLNQLGTLSSPWPEGNP